MTEVETTIHQSLLSSSDVCREMAQAHSGSDKHDSPCTSVSNYETRFDRSREIIPAVLVTKVRGNVEILHQAKHSPSFWLGESCCCSLCDYQNGRKYFYVLENGYEFNEPYVFPTILQWISLNWLCCCDIDGLVAYCFRSGFCFWIPPNSCCISVDAISKVYFDRGFYDRQCFLYHSVGGRNSIFRGPPTIYSGPTKYVCCCMDCPAAFNEFIACSSPILCGEKISARPCSEVMGCELQASFCCNCCGICGIKSGEPICVRDVTGGNCLAEGEGVKLAEALNYAHSAWKDRQGLQKSM